MGVGPTASECVNGQPVGVRRRFARRSKALRKLQRVLRDTTEVLRPFTPRTVHAAPRTVQNSPGTLRLQHVAPVRRAHHDGRERARGHAQGLARSRQSTTPARSWGCRFPTVSHDPHRHRRPSLSGWKSGATRTARRRRSRSTWPTPRCASGEPPRAVRRAVAPSQVAARRIVRSCACAIFELEIVVLRPKIATPAS